MPKIDGPLFSDEATGTLAGRVTFSNQWGWAIARSTPQTRKDISTKQRAVRQRVKTLSTTWRTLSPYEKADYASRAPEGWTGFDLFINENFDEA